MVHREVYLRTAAAASQEHVFYVACDAVSAHAMHCTHNNTCFQNALLRRALVSALSKYSHRYLYRVYPIYGYLGSASIALPKYTVLSSYSGEVVIRSLRAITSS